MTDSDDEELSRARRVADRLAIELGGDPAVSLVDVGLQGSPARTVLRVHLRGGMSTDVPETVDDIPVVIMRGDYRPE
jgi:hypothetical protein